MTNEQDDFTITVQVGQNTFSIDGMLVMAELALVGEPEPMRAADWTVTVMVAPAPEKDSALRLA